MSENNNDLGAFLAGFVIGGLVGAATTLILAPQSGEETRNQIVSKSRELRESGGEQFQHYREMADSYSQEYRDRAGKVLAETRNRVGDTTGRVQEQARIVLDSGKDKVSQVKGQVDAYRQKEDEQASESGDEDLSATS